MMNDVFKTKNGIVPIKTMSFRNPKEVKEFNEYVKGSNDVEFVLTNEKVGIYLK